MVPRGRNYILRVPVGELRAVGCAIGRGHETGEHPNLAADELPRTVDAVSPEEVTVSDTHRCFRGARAARGDSRPGRHGTRPLRRTIDYYESGADKLISVAFGTLNATTITRRINLAQSRC